MLKIRYQKQFAKDYKLVKKRGLPEKELRTVIELLQKQQKLPAKYHDHSLTDTKEYSGVRECHIRPDWLLIYKIQSDELVLILIRTGSHSDLF